MKRCSVCQKTYDDAASFCAVDATPLGPPSDSALEGRIVDRKYRIQRLLGEGGMGSVYEAVHVEIGRRVALKLMNPGLLRDPAALERFRREARAAGRLEHTNAVTVHDFGVDETGDAYLVMELLDGPTLRDVLLERGVLSPAEVCDILEPVAAAIDAAHAAHIVHRDLKPDNIMLARRGSTSVVKVLDFGIAKVAAPDAGTGTLTGTGVIGTPYYMSPEQGEGHPLDYRSDIYSLGVVAFELLTGRVPFRGDTPISTLVKHVNTPPPRPSTVLPTLSSHVDDVILWALEKDPSRRPPTASAFAGALRSASGGGVATVPLDRTIVTAPPTNPVTTETRPARAWTGPQPTPTTLPSTSAPSDPASRKSGAPMALFAAAIGLVLVVAVAVAAGLVYANRERLGLSTASPSPTPVVTPSPGPSPSVAPSSAPQAEPGPPLTTPGDRPAPSSSRANISASSTRVSQGANVFTADRAFDGRPETAWCEGVEGPGIGESVTQRFESARRVARIRILPGYFKSADRWAQNNRLAAIRIVLSDGRTIPAAIDDDMREQTVAIGGGEIEWITIVIDKVWPGGDGLDTLISEVRVDADTSKY
jgi:serine/threonine protein kinase